MIKLSLVSGSDTNAIYHAGWFLAFALKLKLR